MSSSEILLFYPVCFRRLYSDGGLRGRTAEEILEDLNMADDSLDRLKAANPYIAHVKLEDRNSNSSTWCVYVRDPRWPADRCSGLYGEDDRWRESLRKKTGTGRGKCFKNDCNGRICVTLPPMETMRDVCEKLNRRCSIYSILSISFAPVYDLLCLVENNASDGEDLFASYSCFAAYQKPVP